MICCVEGCERPLRYKESRLCGLHYQRQRKHGDPLGGGRLKGEPLRWIKEHVAYEGDDCLIWLFARSNNGYGCLRTNGRKYYAHRLMCELAHGEPIGRVDAAHSCGRGRDGCVNPKHLRWATRLENMQDSVALGAQSRGAKHGAATAAAFKLKSRKERIAEKAGA